MIISKTPLRCSFFGGGTDFKDYYENSRFGYGTTISTALDMHVYITVNKKFDDMIRIAYFGNELVNSVDEVKHNIIREAMRMTGIVKGVEIIYMADIPFSTAGVGLASSSALTVGVLNALYAYKGEYVTVAELAKQACQIEIDILGQQIGIQDQYAVAYGGFNRYHYHQNGIVDVSPVVCKKEYIEALQENLMLFYTGMTRDSRKILSEQTSTIANKMNMLDSLVEVTDQAYQDLARGNIDNWGYLLDKSWEIKKHFAGGVSNELIDGMYQKAKAAGALGGKILGAGGGGFLLLYVPKEHQNMVAEELKDYRRVDFATDPQGSRIIFSD